MRKFTGVAPYFYGAAIAAFGIIQLVIQNFLSSFLPVPPTLPFRWLWMMLTSVVFILSGLTIVAGIWRRLGLVVAGMILAIFLLALQLPLLLMNLHNGNNWAIVFEGVMLTSGAFIIAAEWPGGVVISRRWDRTIDVLAIVGHYLFALGLFVFSIQHIMYFDYILSLIPAWMPARLVLNYLVIIGYILCGVSMVIGRKVGLATSLLGMMFFLWVLLLHLPRAVGKWNVETEWTSLFVALAVCGIAFSMARREYSESLEYGMSFVAKGG